MTKSVSHRFSVVVLPSLEDIGIPTPVAEILDRSGDRPNLTGKPHPVAKIHKARFPLQALWLKLDRTDLDLGGAVGEHAAGLVVTGHLKHQIIPLPPRGVPSGGRHQPFVFGSSRALSNPADWLALDWPL